MPPQGGSKGAPLAKRVVIRNPKNGTKPKAAGGKNTGPKKPGATKPKVAVPGVGFDPQKMAATMTDLGYGASIADMQRQIAHSEAAEAEALKDLQGWAAQIEDQRAVGAAQAAAAWSGAKAENAESTANINELFGGPSGEAAAYGGAGQDLLSALSASGASFDARMAPILGAQSLDYKRRASGEFNSQQKELQGQLGDLRAERGQAHAKNLMDMMDMAWGRKQDMLQYQTGQQALKQAAALQKYELAQAQQGIQAGKQEIQSNNLDIKAQKLAIKKSTIELQKIANNPSGIDWNAPDTRSNIGNAALSGSTFGSNHPKANVFQVNPKVALMNAMDALKQMGLLNDPRAVEAVRTAFAQTLRLSHAKKMWVKWRINKNGQLVFAPAGKKPAVVKKGKRAQGLVGPPAPESSEDSFSIGDIFGGLRGIGR